MREIKFRGKRISNGEWLYGDLMQDDIGMCCIYPFKNKGLKPVLSCTIGQYTGLKDKNGKEIYEGDIIRSLDSEDNPILHHIEYQGASFVAILKGSFLPCGNTLRQDWIDEFEKVIIGNIHDDKEYLED